jgi:thioredoxin 1
VRHILDVNALNWEEDVMKYPDLVVVNFYSEVCPWCKSMDPIYDEISNEYKNKVKFAKVNVLNNTENRDLAVKYGVIVTPTLFFICDGKPYEWVAGFQDLKHMKQLVEDVIKNHQECLQKTTTLPAF